jgi:hypothetical protein
MRILLSLFLIFTIGFINAQNQRTVYGYVSSLQTGEKLIGVTLFDTLNRKGAVTNEYGFYSLTSNNERLVLKNNSFGYESQLIEVPVEQAEMNIKLTHISEMDEVVITANSNSNIDNTKIGTMELSMEKVDKLPVLLGEKDVLKILQLMPGVKSGGEGSSGLYVRGGGPDQNLILLDGVPVYNASHLFGFFSVFNSDAI